MLRHVRPLLKDPIVLEAVAERLRTVPSFLEKAPWQSMLEPNFVGLEVDNVGVVAMDRLVPGVSGRVHITFWDKRLRGRELLCRRIAEMWLERYQLQYVYTSIPLASRMVLLFCERVGFKVATIEDGYVHLTYLHGAKSIEGGR